MKLVTNGLAILLCGCSAQPPADLVEVLHTYCAISAPYSYKRYASRDYRPMVAGESGNCARYAASFAKAIAEKGRTVGVYECMVSKTTNHAFVISEGWALDNRFISPVTVGELGCLTSPTLVK